MSKIEKKGKEKKKTVSKKVISKKVMGKKNNKRKILISILIGLTLLIGAIATYFIFIKKEEKKYLAVPVSETTTKLEDGSHYILGASNTISFDVEKSNNFSSEVVDASGNKIETINTEKDNIVTINAPTNGYVDGEEYTLKIENGKFVDEELSTSKIIIFSVKREAKQVAEIKESVEEVKSTDNVVKKTDNGYILESPNKYSVGNVILIDNKEAYKVDAVDGDNYVLSIPKLEEVYSELDYYGSAYLNLDNPEISKEIEEYVSEVAEKSLASYLIDTVYAEDTVSVRAGWDPDNYGYVINIKAEVQANGKLFQKSFLKNHKFTFEYELILKARAYYNLKLFDNDISITLEIQNKPKVGFENEFLSSFEENLFDNLESGDLGNIIKNEYNSLEKENGSFVKEIATFKVATPVPGLFVDIDFSLLLQTSLKINLSLRLENTTTIVVGYKTGRGIYGDTYTSNKVTAEAFGEISLRAGGEIDIGLNLINIIKVSGGLQVGAYGKASIDVKGSLSDKAVSSSVDINTSAGVYLSVIAKVNALDIYKKQITIYDREWELYRKNIPVYKYEPEIVYHTVTVTIWSDCGETCQGELFCRTKRFAIPDGGTLRDALGFDATFVTVDSYNKNEARLGELYTCISSCYKQGLDPMGEYDCINNCKVVHGDDLQFKELPADYTTSSKIYSNLDLYYRVNCWDPVY